MKTMDLNLSLIDRLTLLFTSLVASLGVRVRERALAVGIGEGVYRRIARARRLVVDLIRRLEAGTLREWARREVARERAKPGAEARARLAEVARGWASMPRRFGWLCPLFPCTERYRDSGGYYGLQLAVLLQDPEMRRMLALSPRIAEALRPVCRMLAVDLALLEVTEAEVAAAVRVAPCPVSVPVPVDDAPVVEAGVVDAFWQQKWAR